MRQIVAGFCVALLLTAFSAEAINVSFVGSSGDLKASATFVSSGTTLTITLANISTEDVTAPNQVLTALFFDTTPDMVLTPVSALLAGSTVYYGPNVNNVGGEWAYGHNLTGVPGGPAEQGTSSTGLGLFGGGNFNGANLQGPVSVDGLQYGLTSAGDNVTTGNAAVTGQFALVRNSVTFTLTMSTSPLDAVCNVRFLYGTSLTEAVIRGDTTSADVSVPDGGTTVMLLGSALAGLGLLRRRFSRS